VNVATVSLHDALADPETKACALLALCREERLEQIFDCVRSYSWPMVYDRNGNARAITV
jgi:hypothetical protein